MKYVLSITDVVARKYVITYYYKSIDSFGVILITPNKNEAQTFTSMEAVARTREVIGLVFKVEEVQDESNR